MKNKKTVYAIILLLFTASAVLLTYAYFMSRAETVNKLTVAESEIEIVEDFPDPPDNPAPGTVIKKEVQIKNLKDESFVRMLVVTGDSSFGGKISIDFNTADWVKEADGYWYYKKTLMQNECTTPLFTTVTVNESIAAGDIKEIICYGESVQAEGYDLGAKPYLDAFAAIDDYVETLPPETIT